MLGALEHSKVRDVLVQGHIFLNTSLTEAFCMAIIEAASCGLQVVSTKVGGIPEVLPSELIILTEPNVDAVYEGLLKAIEIQKNRKTITVKSNRNRKKPKTINEKSKNVPILCPFEVNSKVAELYNWSNVAQRTEIVYKKVLKEPDTCLGQKLEAYLNRKVWPFVLVISLMHLLLRLLDWWYPREMIDICRDFRKNTQMEKQKKK